MCDYIICITVAFFSPLHPVLPSSGPTLSPFPASDIFRNLFFTDTDMNHVARSRLLAPAPALKPGAPQAKTIEHTNK